MIAGIGLRMMQIHQGVDFIERGCLDNQIRSDMNLRIWFLGIFILRVPFIFTQGIRNRNWQQISGSVIATGMAIAAIKTIHDWALAAFWRPCI